MGLGGTVLKGASFGGLYVIERASKPVDESKGYLSQVEQRVTRMPTLNTYDSKGEACIDIVSQMESWDQEESGFFEMRNITRAPVDYLSHKEVSTLSKVIAFTFKTFFTGLIEAGFHVALFAVTLAVGMPFMAIASIFSKDAFEVFKSLPSRMVFHLKESIRGLIQAVPIIGPFAAKAYDMGVMMIKDLFCGVKIEDIKDDHIEKLRIKLRYKRILKEGVHNKSDIEFLKQRYETSNLDDLPPCEGATLRGIVSHYYPSKSGKTVYISDADL